MPFVKENDVDLSKIFLGEIYVATQPAPYQSVPIKYDYGKGVKGDFVIRTPLVSSSGLIENKDTATGNINAYTLPVNLTEEQKFSDLLVKITEQIKELLRKKEGQLRKNKKKSVNIDDLNIIKYKEDGSSFVYAKLYTTKDLEITTNFQMLTKKAEGKPLKDIVPLECKRCDMKCWVGLKMESVFFNSLLQTIRIRGTNVIVKKKTERSEEVSIYDEDLDLNNSSDEEKD